MKAFNSNGVVVPVFCGLWACPVCCRRNADKWAWRAMLQLDIDPRPCLFWTLTMPGSYLRVSDAFDKLPQLWDVLRKTIQRDAGSWTYLAFVEGQAKRDGMPHFHVLSYRKSPIRLKDLAAHVGFGYQAKEIPVLSKQAAAYVSKYASKGDKAMPRGFRRVRASRDWAKLPYRPRAKWIVPAKGEDITHYLIRVSEETNLSLDVISDAWVSFDLHQIVY